MGLPSRIIPHMIVFLLLMAAGALVNIAVAWASVAWLGATLNPSDMTPPPEVALLWRDHAPASAADARPLVTLQAQAPASVIDCIGWGQLRGGSPLIEAFVTRAGWPMHAVIGGRLLNSVSGHEVRWAFPLGGFSGVPWLPRDLPYRPLWSGFAINTLFYAAMLWMLFAAPLALRRRRRIKRGLCPACAYPVGDNKVCTECGKPHTVKPKEMAA